MSDITQFHLQRLAALKAERSNWENQWEEAASRVLPSDVNAFNARGSMNAFGQEGQKKTDQQFDSTAAFAAQRFSSVMESLVTPQNAQWCHLKPTDSFLKKNRAARVFFDELTDLLFDYRQRPKANFVGNSQQVYLSLGVYGNGSMYVDAPEDGTGLRYRAMHLGETYFSENHAGIVDTMYRCFWLTAQQYLQWFGENSPEEVKVAAGQPNQIGKKFEVLHCVFPYDQYDPTRMDVEGKRFASIYIAVSQRTILARGGYDTFPYAVARYTQASGELYGRGPSQFVLPAIKTLGEQKKTLLRQGHRAVEPIYLLHDDGVLGNFSVKPGTQVPGGVSKDGKALVHTLPVGNVNIGEKMMEIERNEIKDAFLITLFQILIDTPQMTATEVLQRAQEKGMLLAPTAGRLQNEFLGPLIERELSILRAQGIWPRIPDILKGVPVDYRVEYDSPMSRMQRAEKAAGFMRALDAAANYAKMTMDSAPLDWFNFDAAMPEILDIQGAPVAWTRTIEEVMSVRDQRAQQAQQQQMLEAAPSMAAMAKVAPDLTPKG